MKILYFFPEKSVVMHQWQRTHFLDELPRHGITIDTLNPLQFRSFDEANEVLLKSVRSNNYDLFFTNLCQMDVIYKETLAEIKKMGLPALSFRGDNLLWAQNDQDLAPYFDLVWLTSIETKYLYDKWNVNTIFLPYAANPFTFVPRNEVDEKKRACFVGTPYGSRSIMINELTKGGIPVDVFCKKIKVEKKPGEDAAFLDLPSSDNKTRLNTMRFKEGRKIIWGAVVNKLIGQNQLDENRNLTKLSMVEASKQSEIYSSYTLSLATTSAGNTDILKNNLPVINLRSFEIPMSGGLQICRYNSELASYFEEDKEIIFYRSKEEYLDKAKYYLCKASSKEISEKKNAARKRAEGEHTWTKRFDDAIGALGIHK